MRKLIAAGTLVAFGICFLYGTGYCKRLVTEAVPFYHSNSCVAAGTCPADTTPISINQDQFTACTTSVFSTAKWSTPPAQPYINNAAASGGGDTIVVARLIIRSDSLNVSRSISNGISKFKYLICIPGAGVAAGGISRPVTLNSVDFSTEVGDTNSVISIPIFFTPKTHSLLSTVARPAAGGLMAQPGIQVIINTITGTLRKARAQIVYYTDEP